MPENSDANGASPPSSFENLVPELLRAQPRWLIWDYAPHPIDGKPTKKPRGSLLDPGIGGWLENIERGARLGFTFTGGVDVPGGRLHALDIDGCRNPTDGSIAEWARAVVINHANSYTEVTPSGTGLRQWVIVAESPKGGLAKIRIDVPPPPGVDKTPEIQVFGSGSAQYVTVTGDHLPGTKTTIEVVKDFAWLQTAHQAHETDLVTAALPKGVGEAPPPEVIRARVLDATDGPALLQGDWHGLTPSASEAWWRLLRHVLAAAENHGQDAALFLLNHTPWGEGLVDSRDPSRYARRGWVTKDLARIGGKTDARPAAELFDDDFDASAWEPPEGVEIEDPDEDWLLHGPEFVGLKRKSLPFVVFGFMPAESLVQFYGKPSCGKTPYALSLALSVACGRPEWCGFEIDLPGAAVYMVGEGGPGLANRIAAQLTQFDDLATPFEDAPFFVTTRPGQLFNRRNCEKWVKKIRAKLDGEPLRLLTVDTQNMNFGDGDENATKDMTIYLTNLKWIAAQLGCAVLLVHHVGLAVADRARGSSTQEGALDAGVEIKKTGMLVTGTTHKSKDWESPPPILASLEAVSLGEDEKGRPITAITLCEGEPDPGKFFPDDQPRDELLDLLRAVQETEGRPTSQAGLAALAGVGRKVVRGLVERAEELDLVRRQGATGSGSRKTSYHLTEKGLATWPQNPGQVEEDDALEGLFS